ncbi:hypothetical protein [Aeromonas veronii]|uniref:hypothetical protein n=1 Tax=Aeromonas veronii TaxID=654 RepID=UPI003BA29E58
MEAQTLQQQTPIYHVCQQCNGAGCQACSDLLILDGDIQLDPEWVDELPEPSPINGVIGVKSLPACKKPLCIDEGSCICGIYLGSVADSSPKYDIRFDDRNMYQRREDDLRLAGEWEV